MTDYIRKREQQQRVDEFWEQVSLIGNGLILVATLVTIARRLFRR